MLSLDSPKLEKQFQVEKKNDIIHFNYSGMTNLGIIALP